MRDGSDAHRPVLPALLTVPGVADYLVVKPSWVYDHSDEIPGKLKIGGQLRFRRQAIEAWLERLEAEAAETRSDGQVLERVSRLVAQTDRPNPRAHDAPQDAQKATAAPRRRGRHHPWQIPGQGAPP
jgi:predicted DNA-binding transcriptional regulator AlpA